ncbi:glycosyltransferase family 4 protein [Rhodovulum sulfidophilum]|uniref:glycosyltransferase n=1 Tax=Rhodovulum sulfidophilum TaxID=35806 RepID=UPI0019290D9B|nr:glycosyltransferase family 4 protein [Rhodovulum sulfidophilum]
MGSVEQPRLVIIAGKRKAGTTFLFHALRTDWHPALKDRSWHEMRAQVDEFRASGASSGVVAKADAIYDAQRLDAELRALGVGPDCAEMILLDRNPWERFLSFIGHEKKLGQRPIEALRDAFNSEETAAAEGRKALASSGWKVTDIRYEDLRDNPPNALLGLPLGRVAEQRNSRGEMLPFFGLIRRLVESSLYGKIRETRAIVALKSFYYTKIAHRSDVKNGFVHAVVLGSVAGPMDGQRRITGMFVRRSSFRISLIDFVNHRRWWGGLKITSQVLQGILLALFGRVDVVYLAISRSNFGLIRDFLLLSPLMLSNPRVVAHVHGAEFDDYYFKTPGFHWLKSKQLGRVDQLLFIHEQLQSQAPDIASKSNVLRNPVPDFARAARPAKPLEVGQRPTFGFISAFVPGKGIEDFLELAEGRAGQARFCIAGGTHPKFLAYGTGIEDQIKTRADIEYLGYLGDPSGFYQQVDFVVFPTSYVSEALPGVVLEALSFGCVPIVKRSNLLPAVFAGAPIRWFNDRESLLSSAVSLLAQPLEHTAELKTAGQRWVRAEFPSEADWLERLERNLLGWETGMRDFDHKSQTT